MGNGGTAVSGWDVVKSTSRQAAIGRRPVLGAVLALLVVVQLLLGVTPSSAAFPGYNGRIAFVSFRDGNREIYSINPDGTGLTRLTNNPAADTSPQWSPDGIRLAFDSDRSGEQHIYVMNADGSGVTNLTAAVGGGSAPSWSPDGQRLAYGTSDGEIAVLTLLTGTVTTLTTDACIKFPAPGVVNEDCPFSRVANRRPSWSPDGHLIAFIKNQGTSSSLWVMNADGTNSHRLSSMSAHATFIDWAPDGQRLAYSDTSQSVQVLNRDGSGEYVVPNTRQCPAVGNCFVLQAPAWSPDGTTLVAATAIQTIPAPGLYTVAPDGSGLTRILVDNSNNLGQPSWQVRRIPPLSVQTTAAVCTTLATFQSPLFRPFIGALTASLGCDRSPAAVQTADSQPVTVAEEPPVAVTVPQSPSDEAHVPESTSPTVAPVPVSTDSSSTIPLLTALTAVTTVPPTSVVIPRLVAP